MSLRILVVDDSEAIRQAVRTCIESNTDWQVCAEAENGAVALERVRELNPDIVILDLSMPGMNGLDLAREIAATALQTRMIMFTSYDCEQLIKEAQEVGISKVVTKSGGDMVHYLLAAIRDVMTKRDRDAA
jgi:DNA-binding NarL/FixJ family response regulator